MQYFGSPLCTSSGILVFFIVFNRRKVNGNTSRSSLVDHYLMRHSHFVISLYYIRYSFFCLRSKAKDQRPRNYFSCSPCSLIFRLIYATYVYLPTSTYLHQHTYLYQHTYLCLPTNIYQSISTYLHTYVYLPTYVKLPSSTYLPLPIPKY